jgi:hypothetical protein
MVHRTTIASALRSGIGPWSAKTGSTSRAAVARPTRLFSLVTHGAVPVQVSPKMMTIAPFAHAYSYTGKVASAVRRTAPIPEAVIPPRLRRARFMTPDASRVRARSATTACVHIARYAVNP